VELLILVTPELVEPMDASETPPCGPGTQTASPSDWELYMKGHLEVPKCCPTDGNGNCGGPPRGNAPDGPPPDGMILGPGEKIPAPPPAEGSSGPGPYNRATPSKLSPPPATAPAGTQNSPPGFIGPVGYDVVK